MDAEYQQQAQRLELIRNEEKKRQQAAATDCVRDSKYPSNGNGVESPQRIDLQSGEEDHRDPLIYPGVYAPSGFNMLDILVSVHRRPNPVIKIGNIDHSVALTLCDYDAPDMPIIYCSENFEKLSGYSSSEILGRNCRFLQNPPNGRETSPTDALTNSNAREELTKKLMNKEEARVHFVNFTKGGRRFVNILTTIPITWEGGRQFVVGFQVDAQTIFV